MRLLVPTPPGLVRGAPSTSVRLRGRPGNLAGKQKTDPAGHEAAALQWAESAALSSLVWSSTTPVYARAERPVGMLMYIVEATSGLCYRIDF